MKQGLNLTFFRLKFLDLRFLKSQRCHGSLSGLFIPRPVVRYRQFQTLEFSSLIVERENVHI